jgi:ferredoxin
MAETVKITYVEPDGTEKEVQAEIGKHLLDVAHENNIELEGLCLKCYKDPFLGCDAEPF